MSRRRAIYTLRASLRGLPCTIDCFPSLYAHARHIRNCNFYGQILLASSTSCLSTNKLRSANKMWVNWDAPFGRSLLHTGSLRCTTLQSDHKRRSFSCICDLILAYSCTFALTFDLYNSVVSNNVCNVSGKKRNKDQVEYSRRRTRSSLDSTSLSFLKRWLERFLFTNSPEVYEQRLSIE